MAADKTRSGPIGEVLTVLGVLAGAGTAITATLFAIGFLVIERHNQTLGIISTASPSAYVQFGIQFVFRSIEAAFLFLSSGTLKEYADGLPALLVIWRPLILGVLAVILVAMILASLVPATQQVWQHAFRELPKRLFIYPVLLFVLVDYLPQLRAPLDPLLTSLLFVRPDTAALHRRPQAREVYQLILREDSERSSTARSRLLRLYGKHVVATIAIVLATVLLHGRTRMRTNLVAYRRARDSLPAPAAGDPPRKKSHQMIAGALVTLLSAVAWLIQRVARPIVLVAAVIAAVSLPPIYGVLGMSYSVPCVQLSERVKDGRITADRFLVSDLSTDSKEVVLLGLNEQGEYELDFFDRSSVGRITGGTCEGAHLFPRETIRVKAPKLPVRRRPAAAGDSDTKKRGAAENQLP